MNEPTITCPSCQTEIKLTDSLAAPLIESTRREFERKMAAKDADVLKREQALAQQQAALEKAQETVAEQVQAGLKGERERIAAEEVKKARKVVVGDLEQKTKDLAELQQVLSERNAKLAEAQQAQAELVRKQRELDDARREMELTIEKRVQASSGEIRQKAKQEAEESLRLKVLEKEQTIASMQEKIEELKKKAEQGSQQLQGEVLELELEGLLRTRFPRDVFEPVPKGEFGGDIIQRIVSDSGLPCGSILWESKRAKNWSDGWLSKLRGDQRAAKADLAVIVSTVVPKEIESFDLAQEIWVTKRHCVIPVAGALRHSLLELATVRGTVAGQKTKAELLYQYLTGPNFRHRMNAIVEKFTEMQKDLQAERKAITRMWAKRDAQLLAIQDSTAGMYGDLQGLAGPGIEELEALDLHLLPGADTPAEDREK